MNAELRQMIIGGIDMEVSEGATSWKNPETRLERLEEFRKAVLSYPDAGAEIALPESPGLFSKLGIVLGADK